MRSLIAAMAALAAGVAAAQPGGPGSDTGGVPSPLRWWAALEAGPASVSGSDAPLDPSRTGWRLRLAIGWKATPRLWLGVEASGVGLEAGNLADPSHGESVSELFAVAEVHPAGESGFFVTAGGGRSTYTNNDPAWSGHEGSGVGAQATIGYTWTTGKRVSLGPALEWSSGRISPRDGDLHEVRYTSVSLSLRACYR